MYYKHMYTCIYMHMYIMSKQVSMQTCTEVYRPQDMFLLASPLADWGSGNAPDACVWNGDARNGLWTQ